MDDDYRKEYDREESLQSPMMPQVQYKLYSARYLVMAIMLLNYFNSNAIWYSFTTLQTQLTKLYDVSLDEVSFATLLASNFVYIPGVFFSNYLVDRKGFRFSIVFACFCVFLALAIRTPIKFGNGFVFIFIGQAFSGFGQPIFNGTAQKVSALWFPPHQRTMATTTFYLIVGILNSVCALIPQWFVDEHIHGAELVNQIANMLYVMCAIGLVTLALTYAYFEEKPPTPPSASASFPKLHYWQSMKNLMNNYNFILALVGFVVLFGVVNTMAGFLQPLLYPFGVPQDTASQYVSIGNFMSLVVIYINGFFVSKSKKFKKWIIGISFLTVICTVGIMFVARMNNLILTGIVSVAAIAIGSSLVPIFLEF